jgi:hypothetical protein
MCQQVLDPSIFPALYIQPESGPGGTLARTVWYPWSKVSIPNAWTLLVNHLRRKRFSSNERLKKAPEERSTGIVIVAILRVIESFFVAFFFICSETS